MNTRFRLSIAVTSLFALAFLFAGRVGAVSFSYSSTVGSFISFPGDTTFSFTPAVDNFQVTSGAASGFLGEITGTFTIGTISTIGSLSTAPVTGTGGFVISDGTFDLTATLTWADIQQLGGGGSLNVGGVVNLTSVTYSGSNPALKALATAGAGIDVLSFQFTPPVSLATLSNGPGPNQTSFSGAVSAPDGGTTAGLLSFALLGVEVMRRRIKSAAA